MANPSPIVQYFLDHDAIEDLKALTGLFDLVARGMYREGISAEEMPAVVFLADMMVKKTESALGEWNEVFELAKGGEAHV